MPARRLALAGSTMAMARRFALAGSTMRKARRLAPAGLCRQVATSDQAFFA